MFDKTNEINLLYDFYAPLLTEKQQEVIRLYHCENFSLSEIGSEFSISRQGVYDSLKNAEKALAEYEAKLGLMKKFEHTTGLIKNAEGSISGLIKEYSQNRELTDRLCGIKKILTELDV